MSLPNPFDFSHPVDNPLTLAGREKEVDDATYYLEQAAHGGSYSLAFIGERASGKTSLLNVVASAAEERGLLSVQIRLDESVAENEMPFFHEIFCAVMDAAARRGLFGGVGSAHHTKFVQQTVFLDVEPDPAHEPLAFGRIYAAAESSGRRLRLPRSTLRNDFNVIADAARGGEIPGIVVSLDEADLLASSTALLQTLRNILMDTRGLVFCLAGTEQMFPALSEVFSPVPRQFVRINVDNLKTARDTRRAVVSRLLDSRLDWAIPFPSVTGEIHDITQGNPYEIMLLAHFAFRETVSPESRRRMTLNAAALERVAEQLAQQHPAFRESVSRVRAMRAEVAATVEAALEFDGLPLRLFGLAETAFGDQNADAGAARVDEVRTRLSDLAVASFVEIDGAERIRFVGDSFDKAFLKYAVLTRTDRDRERDLSDPVVDLVFQAAQLVREAFLKKLGLEGEANLGPGLLWGSDIDLPQDLLFSTSDSLDVEKAHMKMSLRIGVALDGWSHQSTYGFLVSGLAEEKLARESMSETIRDLDEPLGRYGLTIVIKDVELIDAVVLAEAKQRKDAEFDPVQEQYDETVASFLTRRLGFRDRVADLARTLLDPKVAETSRWRILNDAAFMALGGGDLHSYDRLSALALSKAEQSITLATHALYLAGSAEVGSAAGEIELCRSWLAREEQMTEAEEWTMYSPLFLFLDRRHPEAHEVISVSASDLLDLYSLAIGSDQAKPSLREIPLQVSRRDWTSGGVLIFAATIADMCEEEGLAAALRAKAADVA